MDPYSKLAADVRAGRVRISKLTQTQALQYGIAFEGTWKSAEKHVREHAQEEIARQNGIAKHRAAMRPDAPPSNGRILLLKEQKLATLARFDEEIKRAESDLSHVVVCGIKAPDRDGKVSVKIDDSTYVVFGNYGEWSNSVYSKGYHRTYGGVWVQQGKYARLVTRKATYTYGTGFQLETKEVSMENFKGGFVLRCIAALFDLPKNRNKLHLRLNERLGLELERKVAGVAIYRRTVLGRTLDYAVETPSHWIGHGETVEQAFRNIRAKVEASKERKERAQYITYQQCVDLGFCPTGINSFRDENGLDGRTAISRDELQSLVNDHPARNLRYRWELERLGITIPRLSSLKMG